MVRSQAVNMLCTYRLKPGTQGQFLKLLRKHWPTLHRAGLATAAKARVLRGEDKQGNVIFIERFAWRNAKAPTIAHQTPGVMAVWEPMGALCQDMSFVEVEPVSMPFDKA
jgi:quinol monooxygenase YgiN